MGAETTSADWRRPGTDGKPTTQQHALQQSHGRVEAVVDDVGEKAGGHEHEKDAGQKRSRTPGWATISRILPGAPNGSLRPFPPSIDKLMVVGICVRRSRRQTGRFRLDLRARASNNRQRWDSGIRRPRAHQPGEVRPLAALLVFALSVVGSAQKQAQARPAVARTSPEMPRSSPKTPRTGSTRSSNPFWPKTASAVTVRRSTRRN